MTHISPAAEQARESAREPSGTFGEQQHSAPAQGLIDNRTPLPVLATAMLAQCEPVPYPEELPAGGKVSADLEDSGGVFVSIEFEDQLDSDGNPIRISLGGDATYDNGWDSIANGEPGFEDSALDDYALAYLRDLHTAIDADAESVRWATLSGQMDVFVARATSAAPAFDHSEEAYDARSQKRGEQLIAAFAHGNNGLEDNATDAVADILAYAKAQGLDIEDITRRAVSYYEDEK